MSKKIDFAVGGQAVIEGVMMRSPNYTVISVRSEKGEILETTEYYQNLSKKIKFLGLPIIRGVINLFEMMFIGTKALNWAASKSMATEDEIPADKKQKEEKGQGILALVFSIVFALGMSIFLFKFLPLWCTDFLSKKIDLLNQNYLAYNFVDGVLKTSFFILYIYILGRLPDVHRVFQYHGAEHKSIMTYENNLPLTVENARNQTRFHPRCGTSFILVVFLLSIFIYTFVPRNPDFLTNFGLRVLFLPIVAGISYEMLKWSAKHHESKIVQLLIKPGLMFQRLTTQEPDDQMLEVALNSLKLSLELEEKHIVA